jgi:hypothetical protein
LGIKINDDVFIPEILQRYFFSVGIRQGECRCGLAFLDSHVNLLLVASWGEIAEAA